MNYYQEKKHEIRDLINRQQHEKALSLVEEELSLPYLPIDFFTWLISIKESITQSSLPKREYFNEEQLREMLFSDEDLQIAALQQLFERDLRKNLNLCADYLKSEDVSTEGKCLLIRELISQEINTEMLVIKHGIEYHFIAKYGIIPENSDGYLCTKKKIEDTYFKNPSLLAFAKTLLYQKCLLHLPLYFEEEELDFLWQEIHHDLQKAITNEDLRNEAIN